jgi:chloramphenicol 3-O-phosphotransferase
MCETEVASVPGPSIVLSGLPCSGKSTLARQLAPALSLPVIDKDDILERLFESQGIGDAAWRRRLSRESDVLFQSEAHDEARASAGAILVSFWHVPGMPADSGTPAAWLADLSDRMIEVHCACPPEVAAERFLRRKRHPGHLDGQTSYDEVLRSLRAVPGSGALAIAPRVIVDTSREYSLRAILDQLQLF